MAAQRAQPAVFIGVVSAKRKAFGFIRAAEFPLDIFFHSSSTTDFSSLDAGSNVEFSVEQQQGKQVAVNVRPSAHQPQLLSLETSPSHGLVGKCNVTAQHGSGFLRSMDEHGQVQHWTFNAEDLAPGVPAVSAGQLVQFYVLIDRRKQLLQEKQASNDSTQARHAYMRATQLRPMSEAERAALDQLQQQHLLVLEALAETFDSAT